MQILTLADGLLLTYDSQFSRVCIILFSSQFMVYFCHRIFISFFFSTYIEQANHKFGFIHSVFSAFLGRYLSLFQTGGGEGEVVTRGTFLHAEIMLFIYIMFIHLSLHYQSSLWI